MKVIILSFLLVHLLGCRADTKLVSKDGYVQESSRLDVEVLTNQKDLDPSEIKPKSSNKAANACNGPSIPLASTSKANPFYLTFDGTNTGLLDFFSPCKYTFDIPANTLIIINVTVGIDCGFFGATLTMGPSGVSPPSIDFCSNQAKVYGIKPKTSGFKFEIIYLRGMFSTGFSLNLYSNSTTVVPSPPSPGGNSTGGSGNGTGGVGGSGNNTCQCGIFSNRIVGGFVASSNAYPYQIGLMLTPSSKPFCGGTIISKNYVLTAAHCTVNYVSSNNLKVSVGDVDFQNSADGGIYIKVAKIFVHPNYNATSQELDFSLLQLEQSIVFSDKVGAACLPPNVLDTFEGANFTISGWGLEASGGNQSPKLKGAYVTGISNNDCKATGYKSAIKDSMICAYNYPKNDTDTCQGDSGGPLVTTLNSKVTLVGVTSFGVGCGGKYPGVYARVSNQKDWILNNSDAGSCQ